MPTSILGYFINLITKGSSPAAWLSGWSVELPIRRSRSEEASSSFTLSTNWCCFMVDLSSTPRHSM